MDNDLPIPREMRTPITEAAQAVSVAFNVFEKILGDFFEEDGKDPQTVFFETIFSELWNDKDTDGDKLAMEFIEEISENPDEAAKSALLRGIFITTSFAIQAMKSKKNSDRAWSFASSAMYWAGITSATPSIAQISADSAAQMAKKRHAENYALAEEAAKYWRENISPDLSAQKAATELTRIVPLSHKKLAEIVSEERKKVSRVRTTEPHRNK